MGATTTAGSAAAASPGAAMPATHKPQSFTKLAVGAIGVVFGDIGTSPLYALKTVFLPLHRVPIDRMHIFGVISLIFWTMMIIVTVKYVFIVMRADNRGEGGWLALLALISRLRRVSAGPAGWCLWACSQRRCSSATR